MALLPRGTNYYSQVMQAGVGAAANTGIPISGSSITGTTAASRASGSYDIVQSDDEFIYGFTFGRGSGESLGMLMLDASQVTLGAPVAGAVRISISTAGKQVFICYRKVNDR